MASTYSTNLKIELMGTGENSGTWGTITNTNLGTAFEQAVIGLGNPDYTSDANLTITLTNSNASQAARCLVLNVTSAFGSLTATRELIVPTIQKQYIVQNNTTGGQSITVKTSAGTGITVPTGRKAHLYVDGTNVIQMFDFVDINGGTIDGTAIGAASASTGAFTSLTASGATTLNGAVALGDASGDLITVPGTVNSNLLFTDATYDIGASGATRPRDMFLSRNLTVGGTLTLAGGVNLNGNVTVGDSSADTLTINSTITSNLIFTDNTYDIGASGATRPRNLFLAGNATIGGAQTLTGALTVDSTTDSSSTTTGSIQTDGGVGIAKALFVGTTANIAGVATFSAGSAAAPAITTTGDTNTGIFFPAADTIAFTEGGVESMRIDSAGNLGLGVTPSAWAAGFSAFQFSTGGTVWSNGANAIIGLNHYYNGSNYIYRITDFASRYQQQSGQHIWLQAPSGTAGNAISFTQAMTLTAAGDLGVGTTSPATRFHSQGSEGEVARIGSGSVAFSLGVGHTGNGTGYINLFPTSSPSTSPTSLAFQMGGTERARIDASGNFLVGATSGTARIIVGGGVLPASGSYAFGMSSLLTTGRTGTFDSGTLASISNAADAGSLELSMGSSSGYVTGISLTANAATNFVGAIRFLTASTERARIDSSGNFGIGTASPTAKLNISGTGNTLLLNGSGTSSNYLRLTSTGADGVLGIEAATPAIMTGSTTYATVFYSVGATPLQLGTNSTVRATIDSSGNLGLGVTPSAWSGIKAFEFGTGTSNGTLYSFGNDTTLSTNMYYNGGFKYISTATSTRYQQSTGQHIWYNAASGTAGTAISYTQAMTLDADGDLGIGTTSPSEKLDVVGTARVLKSTGATNTGDQNTIVAGATTTGAYAASYGAGLQFQVTNSSGAYSGSRIVSRLETDNNTANLVFQARNYGFADSMTLTAAGNFGIGTSSPTSKVHISQTGAATSLKIDGIENPIEAARYAANGDGATIFLFKSRNATVGSQTILNNGDQVGVLQARGSNGSNFVDAGSIVFAVDGTPGAGNDMPGRIVFNTTPDGSGSLTERMRITSGGNLLVATTSTDVADANGTGASFSSAGNAQFSRASGGVVNVNRKTDDGVLVFFQQDATSEGNISVSGTTVSYNGGHLSRYAQTTTVKDNSLLKGTVLSNLDEMNVYTKNGQPVDNEQLNKVKMSDVEGDINVAGVFVNWDHDEAHNVDEINMAMTGDMIIRIAQGTTVVRGDLLMSAGDGTAKPQGDDIVRSKTVAKVTSNHVTCTYADGSYCVPCVLMAC